MQDSEGGEHAFFSKYKGPLLLSYASTPFFDNLTDSF